jgi:hypothetical protein
MYNVCGGHRYSRWNDDEEKALRQGVAKYGEGKWKRILADTGMMKYLDGRTNVDLKVSSKRQRENSLPFNVRLV